MALPRLLLFGFPSAGKSALLGALAEVASAQPAMLKGIVIDPAAPFADLQKKTYGSGLPSTEQLTTYSLGMQSANPSENTAATIIDSSGAADRAMLLSTRPFADANPMIKPLLDADTIVVPIDASGSPKQLTEQFAQFGSWLKYFHEARGRRMEIGDLPVYIVLTKCDLLVKPNDSFGMWMQRIEEGKRRVDQKFQEMLNSQGTGFGTIRLRFWATSIGRPALADRPAKAQEPLGVAELFRQGLRSAQEYQARRNASQTRLHNLFIGLMGLIAMLAIAVTFLAEHGTVDRFTPLDDEVQAILPRKKEDRLRAPIKTLDKKRDRLRWIQQDPGFSKLSVSSQEAVLNYETELDRYLAMYEAAHANIKSPQLAKNEAEFMELKKNLDAFQLPEAHAKDWADTRLVRRVNQVRSEFQKVDDEVKEEEKWIRLQIKKNNAILKEGNQIYSKLLDDQKLKTQDVEVWNQAYREGMQPQPRKPLDENLPGTHMTYEDLDKFTEIKKAHKDWNDSKAQLKRVADNIQDRLKTGA